jgi:hypothetical protein
LQRFSAGARACGDRAGHLGRSERKGDAWRRGPAARYVAALRYSSMEKSVI